MPEKKYCDIKRYFKNEHNEYYRLLKDKLCTGLIFSGIPKCYLVPTGELLKSLQKIQNTEELHSKIKHLILRENLELNKVSATEKIENINGYILDDNSKLMKDIESLKDGSRYKTWDLVDKKNSRGVNTVFIYTGKDVPTATKKAEKSDKDDAKKKKGKGTDKDKEDMVKKYSLLKAEMEKHTDSIEEICNHIQHSILCHLMQDNNDKFVELMTHGYYTASPVISLVSIVKAISYSELKQAINASSDVLHKSHMENAPECLYSQKVRESIKKLKTNADMIKADINRDLGSEFQLSYDIYVDKIEQSYKSICKNLKHLKFSDVLLFDELKYIFTKSATENFKKLLNITMTNTNIVFFKDINVVDLIKNDLTENMKKFVESPYFLYVSNLPISGGSNDSKILLSLENEIKKIQSLMKKISSKKGGSDHPRSRSNSRGRSHSRSNSRSRSRSHSRSSHHSKNGDHEKEYNFDSD